MNLPPEALREAVAADLLDVGAVVIRPDEPFTWASGLRAPVYCDNRLTLAYPRVRRRIADALASVLEGADVQAVAGVATAGIPQAALVAERLGLPLAYVRAQPKGHGRENRIEGRIERGQHVALVEDLLSTGGSALAAADALQGAGAEPTVVLAVFTYGLEATAARFKEVGLPAVALTDLETLLRVADQKDALDAEGLETLRAWRADPEGWSHAHA